MEILPADTEQPQVPQKVADVAMRGSELVEVVPAEVEKPRMAVPPDLLQPMKAGSPNRRWHTDQVKKEDDHRRTVAAKRAELGLPTKAR